MYNKKLELSGAWAELSVRFKLLSSTRLQNASASSSRFHDHKPPSLHSPAWTCFESFANELIESSISPTRFILILPKYVKNEVCSEESAVRREKLGLYEDYYTRILDTSPEIDWRNKE
jgi:hypothetical protein